MIGGGVGDPMSMSLNVSHQKEHQYIGLEGGNLNGL